MVVAVTFPSVGTVQTSHGEEKFYIAFAPSVSRANQKRYCLTDDLLIYFCMLCLDLG